MPVLVGVRGNLPFRGLPAFMPKRVLPSPPALPSVQLGPALLYSFMVLGAACRPFLPSLPTLGWFLPAPSPFAPAFPGAACRGPCLGPEGPEWAGPGPSPPTLRRAI